MFELAPDARELIDDVVAKAIEPTSIEFLCFNDITYNCECWHAVLDTEMFDASRITDFSFN